MLTASSRYPRVYFWRPYDIQRHKNNYFSNGYFLRTNTSHGTLQWYYSRYFRFQSNARQDEGVIFLLASLTMEKLRIFFCFVLYSLSEKKKTGLA